jgi:hypothetical protein
MLIYFDESYDNNHKYLILGALFNPKSKYLHKKLITLKDSYFFKNNGKYKELKYNNCINEYNYNLCCGAIDIFMESQSYFRAVVIDQSLLDLDYFGRKYENKNIKMARVYKKFAEMLISNNSRNIKNGVLLTDELTRCKGDEFIEIMKQEFCSSEGKHKHFSGEPILKHIMDIHSHVENYQVCQINDILIGCILNNLVPTKKKYKNDIRNYLINKLKVGSLLSKDWKFSKKYIEENSPKFNIWYWFPIQK